MHNKIQISDGQRFGFLTVICEKNNSTESGFGPRRFLCRCDCGNETTVFIRYLTEGQTKSCGCLKAEMIRKKQTTHGMSGTTIYSAWINAVKRCENPRNRRYRTYGGRGIKLCTRWRNSVEAFAEDMGIPPSGWTLERVDVDGDYEPGNCVWATADHQARNTTRNVMLTVEGQTKCLAEWSRIYGINYVTVAYRIRQKGWDPLKALTAPKRSERRVKV